MMAWEGMNALRASRYVLVVVVREVDCLIGYWTEGILLDNSFTLSSIVLTILHDAMYDEELVDRFHTSEEEIEGEIQVITVEVLIWLMMVSKLLLR